MSCQRVLRMRTKGVDLVLAMGSHVEMYFAIECLHPENSDLSESIGEFLDI